MIRLTSTSRIRPWERLWSRLCIRPLNIKAIPRKARLTHSPIPVIDHAQSDQDIHSFNRLSQAYQILGGKTKFSWSALQCEKFYEAHSATLLEDLMTYPRINKDMMSFLFHHYRNSSSIRVLILNNIVSLLLTNRSDLVIAVFQEMQRADLVPAPIVSELGFIISQRDTIESTKLQVALTDILVRYATISGEAMASCSYLLQFHENGISVSGDTLRQTITSLMVDTDVYHSYNTYTILKVLDVFGIDLIGTKLTAGLLEYFSRNYKSVYFANELLSRLENSEAFQEAKLSEKGEEALAEYIKMNLESGLTESAISIWLKHIAFSEKYIPALQALFNHASEDDLVQVIQAIPTDLRDSNQRVLQVLTEFYGTSSGYKTEFNQSITKLATPLSRSVYSSLFKAFMYQNHEEAAEKILSILFKSKNGLTQDEFYCIIDKLLQQDGGLEQCIKMVSHTDISTSKLAYSRIFSEIIKADNLDNYKPFLDELYLKFLKLSAEEKALETLTISIIEYLTTCINTRAGKKMYLRISSLDGRSNTFQNDKLTQVFNLEKYGIPNRFKRFMALTSRGRRECLDLIAKQSIRESDMDTLRWCVEEMRFLGASTDDVSKSISRELQQQ